MHRWLALNNSPSLITNLFHVRPSLQFSNTSLKSGSSAYCSFIDSSPKRRQSSWDNRVYRLDNFSRVARSFSGCTISAGVKGSKIYFFSLCTKVYLLLLPWCVASLSCSQGLPNKSEQACIGTTSQSTESEYDPIEKETLQVCVTLAFPESFSH
jgi:hypothetical protein